MWDLETKISRRELTEWKIYAKNHPFGADRDNLHAAIIAATMVNINLRKGAKPRLPADFMPFVKKPAAKAAMETGLKKALRNAASVKRKTK